MKSRKMQLEEGRFLVWVLSQLSEVLEAQALVAMTPLMPAQARPRRYGALRRRLWSGPWKKRNLKGVGERVAVENVERAMQTESVSHRIGDGEEEVHFECVYNGSVANKALELLGKELGMSINRKEVGGPKLRVGLLQTGDLRSALLVPSTAPFVASSPYDNHLAVPGSTSAPLF
jgi:hypothetical protein